MEDLVQAVYEAMEMTRGWGFCWHSHPLINAVINDGVAQGWLYRPSTSQVEWTQLGVDIYKKYNNV